MPSHFRCSRCFLALNQEFVHDAGRARTLALSRDCLAVSAWLCVGVAVRGRASLGAYHNLHQHNLDNDANRKERGIARFDAFIIKAGGGKGQHRGLADVTG